MATSWWRQRPSGQVLGAAGAGAAAIICVVGLLLDAGGSSQDTRLTSRGDLGVQPPTPSSTVLLTPATTAPALTTTTAPAPTTAAPTTAAPRVTAPATTVPATTPTTARPAPARTLTGRVVDPTGAAVPGAYVIGLHTLTVTQADARGDFSMACPSEPLVAASWLLPITTPGPHPQGIATGRDTTDYPQAPASEPWGWAFTGATALAGATTPACTGSPLTLTLPAAATVTVTFTTADGAPPPAGYIDDLYFDDLDPQAALETAPISGGQQVVSGLGAGTVLIDGGTGTLSCAGAGVAPDPSYAGSTVAVTAGQSVAVSCVVESA